MIIILLKRIYGNEFGLLFLDCVVFDEAIFDYYWKNNEDNNHIVEDCELGLLVILSLVVTKIIYKPNVDSFSLFILLGITLVIFWKYKELIRVLKNIIVKYRIIYKNEIGILIIFLFW